MIDKTQKESQEIKAEIYMAGTYFTEKGKATFSTEDVPFEVALANFINEVIAIEGSVAQAVKGLNRYLSSIGKPQITTKDWFEVTDPQPTQYRLNSQFGAHLEEVREMFPEITSGNVEVDAKMQLIDTLMSEVANLFKSQQVDLKVLNNKKFFDSLLDQRVTLTGVAHLKGYAFDEGVARVDVANFTKFVDGVPQYKEGGKVAKGPYFVEPNIPYPAED